jgi:hypothetical protein
VTKDSDDPIAESPFDPGLHVAPAVAHMPTDAKAGRSFSLIPPPIERGNGHTEVVSEFLHSE